MTFLERIKEKNTDIYTGKPLTLAFLGDSVTQGCFELYSICGSGVGVVYDAEAVYHNQIRRIFSYLYPQLPLAIVNAGICGATSWQGRERLDTDVLSYSPDMTVVCYGLNDCKRGMEQLEAYVNNLSDIFTRLQAADSEVIFMTPNLLGDRVASNLTDPTLRRIAEDVCTEKNRDNLEAYLEAAKVLCRKKDIRVCDCHALWKQMCAAGVDITTMLSNAINHPIRELHKMFAYELVKLMLTEIND